MKPYDKKVISKKITQALIGVTTLGTVLAMPISIDMQDNSIEIVKNNKVFADDNIKVGETVQVGQLMPGDIFSISGIDWVVVDKNHEGYPENSVTVMSNDVLEHSRFDSSVGEFGSNHWGNSDLRKYLNGKFYNELSDDLKAGILTTNLINQGNVEEEGKLDYGAPGYGGKIYYTQDKVFLPSLQELGVGWKESDIRPNGIDYKSFDSRDARKAGYVNRIFISDGTSYWTRSPKYTSSIGIINIAGEAGGINNCNHGFNIGFRPILNLNPDTSVAYKGKHPYIKSTRPKSELITTPSDKEAPTIEVTGNTTSWTNKDVILNVSAKDNNKVKSITLPDGKTVNSDKADYTVTKNGTYKFIVEDDAGNKTTKEVVVNKIDKELPTLKLATSIKGSTNGNVDINIDAKDTLSGIKEIKVNGTVIKDNKYTVSTNGTYTVEVIDNAGNKISKQITISNIDRELPNGTVTADKKSWINGNVTLTCTAIDNIGVKSITLPDGKVTAGSKATFVADKNGKYDFIIEDISGNKRTVDYTVSNIDKELPTLNLSTSTTNSTNGNVDINIDAKDNLSGVKEIKVNDTVITGNKYTVSNNGTYIVEVTDNAGNKTSKQIDISNIDKELPTIAVSGNPTEWTNNNVVLNISAKDNKKVKSITLPSGKVISGDKTTLTISKNGTYKFIVEDEAGNKSTKEIVVTKIDKELPVININVKGNKMTIDANDSLSGVKEVFYKVDDGRFVRYDGEVTLPQGAHIIEAKTMDNAGNLNEKSSEVIIDNEDIDKEAPTLEITGNPVDWTNKDIILNVTAKDNKKVKSITLPNGKVVNGDKTTFTISKNGTYKFMVEDEAGNKTTKEVVVNRIDKELPIANINVKDDKMTIVASDKLSGIKEIFYKIDNREFVRYTGEVTLSPGAHKIKVKVIDNAGNTNDQNSTSSEVNVNVEDKGKKDLEDATKAVEKAETTKNEDDIDRAKEKVAKLPDGKDKDDLTDRLDDLEKQIKAEKDAYIKAYNAVKKAKTTLDKEDYEYATKAVHDLNTTIYKNEKAQLQRVLDALKPYIDRKENQSKQEERNKIRNIESLIRKAIATKDPKTIEEAQAAIDKLESSDIKIELQRRLDTTNKVSQMDLAIQARDAVEKLDAYLNYSDIINNLDELKNLYKKAEKATNRLDNNSQYKNRMDKTKGYIEVIETLTKYKENAEKNNILASEKEMAELISKANQLDFTTKNKENIIKEILQFQKQLKELREAATVPEV
ncbi:hypothetical protein EXM63_02190 [Clostridium botulinum]|uniref:DUF6273 domain-containing protein n=1 Tax=Clostridium botulinum TaxID=1491 RepID=A0A6M0T0K0_CLOBO|nr:hypothetical protein [Clostridium botulinum]NFI74396.1 hypothetical protein [Clostridium sporogenes]NFP62304.1 hypothetical protein [Clostridium sporogenes]NFU95544.1 hypothetical protein [Clostridium sporogenes]NFV67877.1 hypothetical protein [Clostridium botulinum]